MFGKIILIAFPAAFIVAWFAGGDALHEVLFVERWPFWAGGIAIGGFVVAFLFGANKQLGVSTGFQDACSAVVEPELRKSWRLPFLAGLIAGGALAGMAAGGIELTAAMGSFDTLLGESLALKGAVFTGGGVLIGFGTRLGGGCTSGHGILGTALFSPASWITTGAFMASGFLVTNVLMRVIAG